MRILLVEDEPAVARMVERGLTAHGHQVLIAETGDDAVLLVRTEPVDFVLLDIVLQDLDGFEVCGKLKGDPATARIPVVIKTAVYGDPEHRRRGIAAGADEYLADPVTPEQLLGVVDALLRDRRPPT